MKILYLLPVIFFINVIYANENNVVPNCMTEEGAFEYEGKQAMDKQNNGSFVTGLNLKSDLERCRKLGSPFATYILAKDALNLAYIYQKSSESYTKSDFELMRFTEKQSQKHLNEAFMLLKESADGGYSVAYWKMGMINYDGILQEVNNISAGKYFIKAGFAAYKENRTSLLNKAYEYATKTVPDHPDLPNLKKLVYE